MYQMYRKIVITIAWALCAIRDFVFSIWSILRQWYRADKSDELDDTGFMEATEQGQSDSMRTSIEAGADVDKVNKHGETALMSAARKGHTEIMKALLVAGADVNKAANDGVTALMYAAREEHTEGVKALIAAGADVDKVNKHGETALMKAAARGHSEIVKALIEAKADVNKVSKYGYTALMFVAVKGFRKIVKALIEAEADVNKINKEANTALMCAAARGHSEIVKALIEAKADMNKGDKHGNTALMAAAARGHNKILNNLIEARVDVNKADNDGNTALMCAAARGHSEMVKALIEAKADVNKVSKSGFTALICAAARGHTEIVKDLIAAKADVNKARRFDYTALMDAAQGGHAESVEALIEAGADVNTANQDGATALMFAAAQGHTETIKALIAAGAYVNKVCEPIIDNLIAGSTALMFAEMAGHGEIITAIESFKTAYPTIIAIQDKKTSTLGITQKNAQEKTKAGYTTLMAACASDNMDFAQKLIDYGADIYAKDVYGRTALSCARNTTMIHDFIRDKKLNIKHALGDVHGGYLVLRRAVEENNKELIQLILQHVPEIVGHDNSLLSLSNDIAVIRLLSRYGIRPPRNIVLQPHIQQEVIIQHILASTPWSYAQRLTMSVGDVKAWMRDYKDMLPKSDHMYHISAIDQETMKEIQACQDDTMKATELLADDRLLYTVYCAKVVGKMKEGEMSLSTKTLVSLIESKMYLEHGYPKQALDKLLGTSEVIDVHIASHRIELEHAMQPLLMIPYESSYDERLLEFSKLFMQDSIATDSKKSRDYQVLLELTDKIITGKSDDLDKSIEELTTKAQAFGEDKEGVESVFAECLVKWTKNWSINNHSVSHVGMFSKHKRLKDSGLDTPDTKIDVPHP